MIIDHQGKSPRVVAGVFVAENATIIGNVEIGEECGIWFGTVMRGDSNSIKVGRRTNIQDLTVVHGAVGHSVAIGDDVTIGHRAIIHGCNIGNRCLIGMGATIMNGVKIGDDCIIGAGALVTENQIIPPKSLVIGFPAKVKRSLTDDELKLLVKSAEHYAKLASSY